MINRLLVAMALCVLGAETASAQTPADAAARIAAAKERAADAGIPAVLLDNKVAEGRAKGVAPDRIAAAIEIRLASLIRARAVMAPNPRSEVSPADLSIGADALDAGVAEPALATLARSAPADRRALAVAVLAQLVQGGEASDRALRRVRLALGKDPRTLQNLPAQLAAEHRREQLQADGSPANPGRPNLVGPPGRGGGPPAGVPAAGKPAGANRPGAKTKGKP